MPLRILNLGVLSSQNSQAIYHAVASCFSPQTADTVILCRPEEPYFCIGHHQNASQVISKPARAKLNFQVMRRRLGGGLTYLDSQQLFYQCVFSRDRSPAIPSQVYAERLLQPIRVLNRIGVNAELRYTNEIEVFGKRIAGIGGGTIGKSSVVVGNILNDFDYKTMAQIVNSPCREFTEMALFAMSERITTLKQEGVSQHWESLPELLIDEYRKEFGNTLYFGELSEAEHKTSQRLTKLMCSETHLNEYRSEQDVIPVLRLKISGSTSIELVLINQKNSHIPIAAVVMLRDNTIEKVKFIDDSSSIVQFDDIACVARKIDFNNVVIGKSIN